MKTTYYCWECSDRGEKAECKAAGYNGKKPQFCPLNGKSCNWKTNAEHKEDLKK